MRMFMQVTDMDSLHLIKMLYKQNTQKWLYLGKRCGQVSLQLKCKHNLHKDSHIFHHSTINSTGNYYKYRTI